MPYSQSTGQKASRVALAILTLACATAWAHADSLNAAWEPAGNDEGVEVFRKTIPGSSVIAFKGKGVIDASLPKVANILLDNARAPEWAEDIVESKVVRWIRQPLEYIEYNHVGTPFVMKDRDFVSHVSILLDVAHRRMEVSYSDVEDSLAPPMGYVRGELSGSAFRLSELDQGKRTLLEGEVFCDPKGSIPKWIVNFFQKSWPLDTFRAIRKQALKPDVVEHPYFRQAFAAAPR